MAGEPILNGKQVNITAGKVLTVTNDSALNGTPFQPGAAIQLVVNEPIILPASEIADQKYSGITEAGVAGATLAFGQTVYQAVADSRWELTDADAEATTKPRVGFCVLAAANDGDATTILFIGKIRANSQFPAGTVGAPAYLSGTAGAIMTSLPTAGQFQRQVGFFETADELIVDIEPGYMEIGS